MALADQKLDTMPNGSPRGGVLGVAPDGTPVLSPLLGTILQRHVAGRWYHAAQMATSSGAAMTTGNARLVPFFLLETITISDLGCRIQTAASGGNLALAIYASDATTQYPTGTPVASTGSISTTSSGPVSADITGADVQLTPGLYWMAVSVDATASSVVTTTAQSNSFTWMTFLLGSTVLSRLSSGGSGSVSMHLETAMTFGTWPNLTAASFTEIANSQASTLIQFKVASVP